MKNIKINHEFNESPLKTEEKKIKWFINILAEKYSAQSVEVSMKQLYKQRKKKPMM